MMNMTEDKTMTTNDPADKLPSPDLKDQKPVTAAQDIKHGEQAVPRDQAAGAPASEPEPSDGKVVLPTPQPPAPATAGEVTAKQEAPASQPVSHPSPVIQAAPAEKQTPAAAPAQGAPATQTAPAAQDGKSAQAAPAAQGAPASQDGKSGQSEQGAAQTPVASTPAPATPVTPSTAAASMPSPAAIPGLGRPTEPAAPSIPTASAASMAGPAAPAQINMLPVEVDDRKTIQLNRLHLPPAEVKEPVESAAPVASAAPPARPVKIVDPNQAHVLVVEDNVPNFVLIARMLAYMGVQRCEWKTSGWQVVEFADTLPRIDLILMDIRLPYEDGFQALEKVRANARLKDTLVVAVTAEASVDQMKRAQEAGFDGFLSKPLDPDRFPEQIRRVLNGEQVWEVH